MHEGQVYEWYQRGCRQLVLATFAMSSRAAAQMMGATPRTAALAALLLVVVNGGLAAQQLAPKPSLPAPAMEGCPPFRRPAAVQRDARDRASALLAEGQREVLAGRRTAALALLAEAASADPTSAEVAYHRARLLEETDDIRAAAAEYCRALALAPGGADADEIRQRFRTLGMHFPGSPSPVVAEQFAYGVEYLERHEADGAERAYSWVILQRPDLAEAYFNRALAHAARGRRAWAAEDLESYLRYAPDAPDRELVLQVVEERLAPPTPSAEQALVRGLILPGLGQYLDGRTLTGAAVTLGAAGGLVLALQTHERDPANDSPGASEPFHPHLAAGLAFAAAVTAAGALEAYFHVRRAERRNARGIVGDSGSSALERPTLLLSPSGLGLQIRTGRRFP